jgi:hypothetical protein
MENFTQGMSEMALERLVEALTDAEQECISTMKWCDVVSGIAWQEVADCLYAMTLNAERVLAEAKANNARIAAL